jgi:hypothetical protein
LGGWRSGWEDRRGGRRRRRMKTADPVYIYYMYTHTQPPLPPPTTTTTTTTTIPPPSLPPSNTQENLRRFLLHFPQEDMLLLDSHELFADPAGVVQDIVKFLRLPAYEADVAKAKEEGQNMAATCASEVTNGGPARDYRLREVGGNGLFVCLVGGILCCVLRWVVVMMMIMI